jgi:hypothetical protein
MHYFSGTEEGKKTLLGRIHDEISSISGESPKE